MVYYDDDATSYNSKCKKEHGCDYSSKTSLKLQKPLTINGKIVLITHTIALLIIIVLEIAGYATPEWVITKAAGGVETTYGLWKSCKDSPTMKKTCVGTNWNTLKGYNMAGVIFMSMSLIMGFLGCSLVLILYCIKDQAKSKRHLCCRPVVKLKMTLTLLLCSSAILGVAAVGFFCSTYIKDGPNSMAMKLGYSSILILVGSVLKVPVFIGLLFGVTYDRVWTGGRGGRYAQKDDRKRKKHPGPLPMNPYEETYSDIPDTHHDDLYEDPDHIEHRSQPTKNPFDNSTIPDSRCAQKDGCECKEHCGPPPMNPYEETYSDIPDSYGGFAEGGSHGGGAGVGYGYPPMTPVPMMMPHTPVLNIPNTPGYYPY